MQAGRRRLVRLHLAEGLLGPRCRRSPVLGARDRCVQTTSTPRRRHRAGQSNPLHLCPTRHRPTPRSSPTRHRARPRPRRASASPRPRRLQLRVQARRGELGGLHFVQVLLGPGGRLPPVLGACHRRPATSTPPGQLQLDGRSRNPAATATGRMHHHRQQRLRGPVRGLLRGARLGGLPGQRQIRQGHPQRHEGGARCHPAGAEPRPGDDRRRHRRRLSPHPGALRHHQRRLDPGEHGRTDDRTQPDHRRRSGNRCLHHHHRMVHGKADHRQPADRPLRRGRDPRQPLPRPLRGRQRDHPGA